MTGVGFDLAPPGPAPAFAFPYLTKSLSAPRNVELERSAVYKLSFDQSAKLDFSEVGWGSAEAKVLSKALTPASAAERLSLAGNNIGARRWASSGR